MDKKLSAIPYRGLCPEPCWGLRHGHLYQAGGRVYARPQTPAMGSRCPLTVVRFLWHILIRPCIIDSFVEYYRTVYGRAYCKFINTVIYKVVQRRV